MINILDSLFAPLARILIARGVLFPDLVERMKAHYVRAAEAQTDGKPTDSRVSVLTGLQRRDVTRLRNFDPKPPRPNHLVTLIALWQTVPGYQTAGTPLALPKNGPAPSFESLANTVRKDVHPRTMLDALLDTETVTVDEDTQIVRLLKSSYQPLSGTDDQITYLAQNLGDHISAACENVLEPRPLHFERAVHYAGLSEQDITALKTAHSDGQMALFESLSRMAADLQTQAGEDKNQRFRAGGYFYQTEAGNT